MAIQTVEQQLEAVQTAIDVILVQAQSATAPDGQSQVKGDLATLYRQQKALMIQYNRQQRGGGARVRRVERS